MRVRASPCVFDTCPKSNAVSFLSFFFLSFFVSLCVCLFASFQFAIIAATAAQLERPSRPFAHALLQREM